MTDEEIYQSVLKVVHESMPDIDASRFSRNTNFAETGIDSMGFMLIICKLESMYDIKIPDEQWQQLHTMNELIHAIHKCLDQVS